MSDGARARVDDQGPAPLLDAGHVCVSERNLAGRIAVVGAEHQVAVELLVLVPGGLLVRDVDRPLELCLVEAQFAREGSAVLLFVRVYLEERRLPSNPALRILEG